MEVINDSEIRELIDKLNYYTKLYDEGKPEISDQEWDDMYFKLQKLENETNEYFEDSPTQSIPYQVINKLKKVEHNHPMLSLDKTKDIEDIKKFVKDKDYICMAKMDGLTCSLRYLNGKLVSAETRGNGLIGENILHNALQVKNIPNKISYKEELIIDGEIICTYKDFKPFENEYKNPRNFASGSIRLLDSKECANRNLTFVAWDIITNDYNKYVNLVTELRTLYQLGFTIVPYSTMNFDIDNDITSIKRKCETLFYPIDGLVFKYNSNYEYEKAGRTDHHFKGGIAYKFYDEEYETTLLDIEWSMGRTGVLTPVAIFEPIDIDGTEISRASLHNQSILKETLHGLGWKGQNIKIFKANQIIPQISWAEKDTDGLTKSYINYPRICPICGGNTEIKKEIDSEVLYCSNPNCEGKLVNKIEHFFGKKGLDAKGISKATIEKLINWRWVNSISDVFKLDKYADEWKRKAGFGEKSVTNILNSIRRCTNCNLESIIAGAGIPLIGRTVACDIASRFDTYDLFREAVKGDYDFSSISGFGYEMNKSLKNFDYTELDYIVENCLTVKENRMRRLRRYSGMLEDTILTDEKELNKTIEDYCQPDWNSVSLEGLTYCITGKLALHKNRQELIDKIENLGGRVVGSVSKNVNWLINNDAESTSAKNLKAKELGIGIITEQQFMDYILNNPPKEPTIVINSN